MKTKLLTTICILFIITILSCKKDPLLSNDINETPVYAGIYDTSFNYHEFSPSIAISVTWDSLNLYGYGKDSIDIDLNGSYDIIIDVSFLNYDSIHLLNGSPNPYPHYGLKLRNGMKVAIYEEFYPIGMGAFGSFVWIDTLQYGKRIDQISEWNEYECIEMWMKDLPPVALSNGCWYYAESTKYIGIRKDNNKFGWIEIDATDYENLIFVRYAIKK